MKEGWEIKKLKDIGETITGNTPSTKDSANFGDYIPFVKPAHFNLNGTINSRESGLSEKGLKTSRLIKANSILMVCIGATIGKTGYTDIPVTANQQINALTPSKEFEPRYFYYALNSDIFFKKIIHGSSQATLPIINKSKWENLTVSFPKSITEQQRIVAILDEAFAAIDKAKENVELNMRNAKELFESELNSIFENKGDGWVEKKLKDVGATITGNTPSTKDTANFGDYIPFVKPAHFNLDGTINSEESGLSEKGLKFSRLIKANSILMVCIGATIGKTGYTEIPVTSNQQINALTPSKEFEPRYFYYALISESFFKKVIHGSSQATLPIINKSKWENLTVSFPKELKQQQKIVEQLDRLSVEIRKLEEGYRKKLEGVEELKKSMLERAFRGKLISEP